MIRAMFPLLLGVLLAPYFTLAESFSWILLCLLLMVLGYLALRSLRMQGHWCYALLLSATLLLLGCLSGRPKNTSPLPPKGTYYGYVQEARKGGRQLWVKVYAAGISTRRLQRKPGRTILYLQDSSALQPGNWLLWEGDARAVQRQYNPGAFDYGKYLQEQGIQSVFFMSSENLQQAPGAFNPRAALLRIRQFAGRQLGRLLSDPQALGVAKALVLGEKSDLGGAVKQAYQQAGLMHVLAVSGLHLGVVAMLLAGACSYVPGLRSRPRLRLWIVLPGIWFFAFFSGGAPSVVRAALMFSLLMMGKYGKHKAEIWNTLAASLFVTLLLAPDMIRQVGCQLSYLAVAGIVFFQPRIAGYWTPSSKLLKYAWDLCAVGLAAQLSTGPLSLFCFHQFPVWFWLTGVLVVPMASAALVLGLGSIFLAGIPHAGQGIGWILEKLLQLMNAVSQFFADLPGSVLSGIWLSMEVLLLAYLTMGLGMLYLAKKRKAFAYLALCSLLALIVVFSFFKIKKEQQQLFTIYALKKQSVGDLFIGKAALSFQAEAVDSSQLLFSVYPHRERQQIEQTERLGGRNIQVQLAGTSLFMLDDAVQIPESSELLWVRGRVWPPTTLPKSCTQVIISGSMGISCTQAWVHFCTAHGVALHDVRRKGAFQINLKNHYNEKEKQKRITL